MVDTLLLRRRTCSRLESQKESLQCSAQMVGLPDQSYQLNCTNKIADHALSLIVCQPSSMPQLAALMFARFTISELFPHVLHFAGKHPCIARGRVIDKSRDSVSVSVDHPVQSFLLHDPSNSWRLDKDEISSNFVRMRRNVMREHLQPLAKSGRHFCLHP